jgi:adenosine deaminase
MGRSYDVEMTVVSDSANGFPVDFARSLPKAELHVHLEGSVDASTLLALAERHGVEPPAPDVEGPADNWTTEDFGSAFDRVGEAGLHRVSHAGEHGPAWEVRHALGAVGAMEEHPLPAMLEAGVTGTLGTDDPPLFHTSLLARYEHAWHLCGLDERGLEALAAASLAASFR